MVVWGASRILVVSAIQTQIINSTTNQPLLIKARRYVYQLIKATQKVLLFLLGGRLHIVTEMELKSEYEMGVR